MNWGRGVLEGIRGEERVLRRLARSKREGCSHHRDHKADEQMQSIEVRTKKRRVFEDGLGVIPCLHCLRKPTFFVRHLLLGCVLRSGRSGSPSPVPRRRGRRVHGVTEILCCKSSPDVPCSRACEGGTGRGGGGGEWGGFCLWPGLRLMRSRPATLRVLPVEYGEREERRCGESVLVV
jgi:hypothetical protein